MDSDDQYDEFGNYIGDAVGSDSDLDHVSVGSKPDADLDIIEDLDDSDGETTAHNGTLIKPEDNLDGFLTAETIYVDATATGKDEPVIKPTTSVKTLEYTITDNELPETTYSKDYLVELAKTQPERIRNVAFVGGLHTGKTSFLDTIVMEVHPQIRPSKRDDQNGKPVRYLSTHKLENERGISIRNSVLSILLQDLRHRSHPVNFVDCPGHPDFQDEMDAALRVVEGAVLVLDAVEGLTGRDKRIVTELIKNDLPFVVVLNKFDRLIMELRLPPRDFYMKMKHVLDDLNSFIHHNEYIFSYTHDKLISPLKNNVVFASHNLRTSFSLSTWSKLYERTGQIPNVDISKLEKLLWGKYTFKDGKFSKSTSSSAPSTFELFIVEPLYKLVTYALVSEPSDNTLATILWEHYKVTLPKSTYKKDPQTLLREVFSAVFIDLADFTQALVLTLPPPTNACLQKKKAILETNDTYLIAEVFGVRLVPGLNESLFLTRIIQGTLRVGDKVHVYTGQDAKKTGTVSALKICSGRYNILVNEVSLGSVVLISGLDESISNCASLLGMSCPIENLGKFHNVNNGSKSVYKVAVECEHPSELPRLVRGLQTLARTYSGAIVKLEDSGEYTILGTGELFLDCFLHDLRYLSNDYLSIKVSDTMVKFSETCDERSVTKLSATSASSQNQISVIAEPIKDQKLTRAIEMGHINLSQPKKTTSKILREEFEWDALAARSLWCIGPKGLQFPSILLDDSLEGDTDKERLLKAKDSITAGFELGVNEGPLCGEGIRDTKFKILDAVLNRTGLSSSSQIIPMTRNAVHIGLLTASPRLLEPVYKVFTTCTHNCLTAIHTLLDKRRGWAVQERAIVGTKMYEIEAYVPVIDSVGFDVDVKIATQGQAFCTMEFCRWDVVPGDPLDKDCFLPPMKPVPRASLARDFVMKTRKRKGLGGEPNLQKYIDPELFTKLRESGLVS